MEDSQLVLIADDEKLYEIVKSLDQQDIELTTSKTRLTLKTSNSSFKLAILPANNFPTLFEHNFLSLQILLTQSNRQN